MKRWKQALASLVLSALFVGVYGGCNWLSAQRTDVGTWYFDWERHLPFVPLMIAPYMSLDLFFVVAPFLSTTDGELKILSQRIVFGILAAGVCFVIYPLRLVLVPPPVDGMLGSIFHAFLGMDKPYNLLPSLHIVLCTILGLFYASRCRGIWKYLSNIWFFLIGASTVLTYQHQIVDVVGGMVLAVYCLYLFRPGLAGSTLATNSTIGVYYLTGSLVLGLAAYHAGRQGLLPGWVALALGLVGVAYFGAGPAVYRKQNGRLPLSTRLVLAPCLWGQYASLVYYRRQARAWDEVVPGVWLGRRLDPQEAVEAIRQGVTAVLDLTAEFDEATPFVGLQYLNVQVLDLTAPSQRQLQTMVDFITQHTRYGRVYVHCKAGYSRSAAAVGAYLLESREVSSVEEVCQVLRRVRPSVVIRPEIIRSLQEFLDTKNVKLDR